MASFPCVVKSHWRPACDLYASFLNDRRDAYPNWLQTLCLGDKLLRRANFSFGAKLMASTIVEPPSAFADYLRLALLPGIGPKHFEQLLERFGSPDKVLKASQQALCEVPQVGPQLAKKIEQHALFVDAESVIRECQEKGIACAIKSSAAYPRPMNRIATAPPLLFSRGQWKPSDELAIAIVGTRHATHYGKTQAKKIAGQLARSGITIVSGLARGIDAAAHEGALDAGGRTIAVLGCGHDHLYPPEHGKLAEKICEAGAVLSEFPPWTRPRGPYFPQRNRIISGLSLGVLVIEAADRSGALVTAQHAMEQGRDVFALPGSVASRASRGCHTLIRDGARLVENAEQIIDELGPLAESIRFEADQEQEMRHPLELTLNDQERLVLDAIGTSPTSLDSVFARTQLPVPRVLSTLSVLEMKRLVRRLSGQFVVRL